MFARATASLSLLLVLLPPAVPPGALAEDRAEDGCIADWSDAAPIVARERLLPTPAVQALSRRLHSGDVVRLTLCRRGDGYVYRLVLRDDRGRLSNRVIDARSD